jgi:aminopeptidase YwaD
VLAERLRVKFLRIPLGTMAAVALFFMVTAATSHGQVEGRNQSRSLISDSLWEAVINEYSGNLAAKHILELSRFHRIAGGSPGYHRAVEYVAGVIKSLGYYEVNIEKHLSDGDQMYLQWRSMPGWDVKNAELRLENTDEVLARYADTPVSLFVYSNSANISAPAVFVGEGALDPDYDGIDVTGKIVLATGEGDAVHREAVLKRGAAGVVVGPSETDTVSLQYPNLVRLYTLSSNKSLREKTRFGFSLSSSQFQKLLKAVKGSKGVRLRAVVDSHQYDAETETVSAFYKGSEFPEQELILSAHLDHYSPGANDNASGSASLLEIARSLAILIDRGIIEKPKRSIRFLWVEEMHGFAGYLSKDLSIGKRGIAGFNMDMVGEDICKTHSVMTLIRPPYSNPSYIGDLVEHMMSQVDAMKISSSLGEGDRLHFRVLTFKGGSDHFLLSDPTIGVPCVNLGHDGDVFHHTNMDDLDKIDVSELKKSGIIALGTLLFVVNAGDAEALRLALEVAEQGMIRLAERTKRQMMELVDVGRDKPESLLMAKCFEEGLTFMDVHAQAEIAAIKSVDNLSKNPQVQKFASILIQDLNRLAESGKVRLRRFYETLCTLKNIRPLPAGLTEEEDDFKKIVPKRLFRGPLSQYYFEDLLGEDMSWYVAYGQKDPEWIDRRAEILNFMDGRRSLLDIYYAVSAEMGRSEKGFYKRLLVDLKKHSLVTY